VKSFYGIRVKTIDYSAVFGYINKKGHRLRLCPSKNAKELKFFAFIVGAPPHSEQFPIA